MAFIADLYNPMQTEDEKAAPEQMILRLSLEVSETVAEDILSLKPPTWNF